MTQRLKTKQESGSLVAVDEGDRNGVILKHFLQVLDHRDDTEAERRGGKCSFVREQCCHSPSPGQTVVLLECAELGRLRTRLAVLNGEAVHLLLKITSRRWRCWWRLKIKSKDCKAKARKCY